MHTIRSAATAALFAVLPHLLPAQQPVGLPTAAPTLAFPAAGALLDIDASGTVWAAGERWKAGFAANGVTFAPFLGSELPSQPVTFRFANATVAGRLLPCEGALPLAGTQRVDYARGALVESYLLTASGIEQTFRFDTLPQRGELVVDVAVDTELTFGPDGDGVAFTRAEGGVRYGRATALDACGCQLSLETRWTGAALRIVVPAAFVATAALPLVIDPVIGTRTVLTPSLPTLSNADMAYDHSLGQYFACYERAFSATDHDVYVAFFGPAMQFQSLLTIDFTSAYWSKPRLAGLEGADAGCVIAEVSAGNTSPFTIQARRFAAGASPAASPTLQLAGSPGYDCRDPDIGGDSSPAANSRFLAVWEASHGSVNDTDVQNAFLTADGASFAMGPNIYGGIGMKRRPHVSKTCGAPGGGTESWAIVYRYEPYQQNTGELRVSFLDRPGSLRWINSLSYVVLTVPTPNLGSDWDVSEPSDHGAGRWYLCSERRFNAGSNSASMTAILFDRTGFAPSGVQGVLAGSLDKQHPTAACDGQRFALSYDLLFSAYDTDIRVHTFRNDQGALQQDDLCAATNGFEIERGGALCAAHGQSNAYGLCWLHDAGSYCSFEAQVYRGVASGGFAMRVTGCGGLDITATGQPAIGESVTFALPNAVGVTGFAVGAPGTWTIAACPGCLLGANGTTLFATSLPLAIPFDTSFVGMPFAVQGFQLVPSGQPCLGQIALSNTIDMQIQ